MYDNQGLDALLEANCQRMICSDGAAPFLYASRASGDLAAALRANDILMKRVKELIAEQVMLRIPQRAGVYVASLGELPITVGQGIDAELASDIAQIRTDLDAFSEAEAAILMASGYIAAVEGIPGLPAEGSPTNLADSSLHREQAARTHEQTEAHETWWFSPIVPYIRMPPNHNVTRKRIGRHIAAAKYRFARPFRLSIWHFVVAPTWIIGLLIMQWLFFDIRGALARPSVGLTHWLSEIATAFLSSPAGQGIGAVALFFAVSVVALGLQSGVFIEPLGRVVDAVIIPSNLFRRIVASALTFVTIPTRFVWLSLFDPLLQRSGRLDEVLKQESLTSTERFLRLATITGGIIPFFFLAWTFSKFPRLQ